MPHNKDKSLVDERSWNEFRDSGFLWLVNKTLQAFGWAVFFRIDSDGNPVDVFPAKIKEPISKVDNVDGCKKLLNYIEDE